MAKIMKNRNRIKSEREREKDLIIYHWLLKHAREKTEITTETKQWSLKSSV